MTKIIECVTTVIVELIDDSKHYGTKELGSQGRKKVFSGCRIGKFVSELISKKQKQRQV